MDIFKRWNVKGGREHPRVQEHLPWGIKAVVGAHGIVPEESLCLVTAAFCRGTRDGLGPSFRKPKPTPSARGPSLPIPSQHPTPAGRGKGKDVSKHPRAHPRQAGALRYLAFPPGSGLPPLPGSQRGTSRRDL